MRRVRFREARRLGLAVAGMLVGAACADSVRPTPGRVEAQPAVVDFGVVTSAPIPFHRRHVTLLNGTDASRVVARVEKSDGLKAALGSGRLVPAGGTGDFIVTLDARDRVGAFAGEVTVEWENGAPPLTIGVRATIEAGTVASVTGPNLEIVGPRDWDFGTIQRQAIEYKDFHIRNAGTEPLVIQSIETHCGCVQGWADERIIAPGATLPIHARVTAAVYPGKDPRKTITVTTNDPDMPVTTFMVYGRIEDAVVVEPSPVEFGEVEPGTSASTDVVVRAKAPGLPAATHVKATSDVIRVERHHDAEGEGVVAALTVHVRPDAPRGPFDARLQVVFPPESGVVTVAVPVRGTVGAPLPVVPAAVNFGLVRENEVYRRVLRLTDVPDAGTLQVRHEITYLTARVEQRGGGVDIHLTYAPVSGMGAVTGALLLTDGATGRSRRVPVAVQFEQASVGN